MNKGGVALIGMIVALVLILVAFFGSWYGYSTEMSGAGESQKMEISVSLTETTTKSGDSTETISHEDGRKAAEAVGSSTESYDLY